MHELSLCQAILEHVDSAGGEPTGAPRRRAHRLPPPGRARLAAVLVGDAHARAPTCDGCELGDRARAGGRALSRRAAPTRRSTGRCWPAPALREPRRRAASAATSSSWPGSTSRRRSLMGRFHRHADGTEHDARPRRPARRTITSTATSATTAATPRPASSRVAVLESILSENDRVADANRAELSRSGVWAVNLMSSPGAGQDDAAQAHARRARRRGAHRRARGRHRHQPRRRRARRPRRRDLARQHERRLRW